MKKIIILLVIAVLAVGYFFFKNLSPAAPVQNFADSEADLILFWGVGCPHCQKVEEYISEHKLSDKLKIAKKEVYYDQGNQQLLNETVKKCPEIDTSQGVGVPLAYSPGENKCFYGDTPIINWLSAKWYNNFVVKKLKSKSFHLSLGVIFRWIVFGFLLYLAIGYLSANRLDLKTNTPTINLSPNNSSLKTQDFSQTLTVYKDQFLSFANRQITEIKKGVVTKIYEDIIKSIDQKWTL